nr:hypothetical protein [Tanacetum cinerariifolium]
FGVDAVEDFKEIYAKGLLLLVEDLILLVVFEYRHSISCYLSSSLFTNSLQQLSVRPLFARNIMNRKRGPNAGKKIRRAGKVLVVEVDYGFAASMIKKGGDKPRTDSGNPIWSVINELSYNIFFLGCLACDAVVIYLVTVTGYWRRRHNVADLKWI